MGSRRKHVADLRLIGRAPLPARWKLVRDGKLLTESTGDTFEHAVSEPGIYRVELWLNIAETQRVWILSNPLYIQP
jgi:hypothetical protein